MEKEDKQFNEFKRKIVLEDIKALNKKYKPRSYEWIPFLGALCYLLRMAIEISGINRGLLRKNIVKYHIYSVFGTLLIYHFLFIVSAFFYYKIIQIAIKKTKEELKNNKL